MVEGTQAQAAGRSIRELERLRDDYLVDIQQVLRKYNIGAGATLRGVEERLYNEAAARSEGLSEAPLRLVQTQVRPEWVDYNGHMTDSRYLQVFGDATDALFRRVGIDDNYRNSGRAMFSVETHVSHLAEAKVLEELVVTTQLLSVDDKRVHLFHHLRRKRDDVIVATCEQIYLHVNTTAAKASALDPQVHSRLEAIRSAHARLAVPDQKGRFVGMPRS
jgi:carnitine 3-dehydrogenase